MNKIKIKNDGVEVEASELYDSESDIYYVSFKTGEPSYAMEIDDILLVDIGIFTQTPTGFRILNFSKHKVDGVEIVKPAIKKIFASARNRMTNAFASGENRMEQTLEKVLT